MSIESLKIKSQSYYYWNDIVYIDDFDIKYLKINKRESRVGIDIYYIGYVLYKLEYITNSVVPLYLNVKSLLGSVEKINGSTDRYLVIDKSNIEVSLPETFKILGWCPAGSVLPHGEKVPLLMVSR